MNDRGLTLMLDTNVWLGAFIASRPDSGVARDLLDAAYMHGATLAYASGSLRDVFFHVGAAFKRQAREDKGSLSEGDAAAINEIAWACAESMREMGTAVPADESDLRLAMKYRRLHSDLEDDMLIASAQRAKADYLVTSDKALIAHAPIAALSPADMIAVLQGGPNA